jgi:uncharacterized protein
VKRDAHTLRLSATDLANHLACRHLTGLDRGAAEGRLKPPHWHRPEAEVLAQRGLEHERAYLAHLAQQGRRVTTLEDEADGMSALKRTVAAMYAGADVIAQATLADGRWFGRADVLLRVEQPSGLGAWSYEALDTKLARETKAGAILQLCLYSELIKAIQGAWPECMYVVPRRPDFPLEIYRIEDYVAYYRFVKGRLEAAVEAAESGTYPDPVPHCEICRWWPRCDKQRRDDDHLCLVAGLSRLQTRELQSHEIATLERLAHEPIPITWKPRRGAREGYGRVREQARIQLDGRTKGEPTYELLPVEPNRGLASLPAPAPGDVFADLEGDPYFDGGGIEYLFGWAVTDPPPLGMLALDAGEPAYHARWALDRPAERLGFEALIDAIMARWAEDPNMHVYHFGAYEPGAMKRLMGRYATRESEVDRLLRAGRFVDLHEVVRQSLRASVEEYSIKKMEPFYRFERAVPLPEASASLRMIERSLELGATVDPSSDAGRVVETYNRDDCLSARALRDWLETLRAGLEARGIEIPRPVGETGDPTERIGEKERLAGELAERLVAGVPEDRDARTREQHGCWLLAHMLEWHRREEKAPWWEFFRLREMSDEELLDEMPALSGLTFVERLKGKGRLPVDRYQFPAQETSIREDSELELPGPEGDAFGQVLDIDLVACTVDVKKSGRFAETHPTSVFAHKVVRADKQAESLMRLGRWVAAHGIDAPGLHRAARDLLLRRPPRLRGHEGAALEVEGEGGVRAARRLALALDSGALAIQGPPGSGKTFTGARMILDLVRAGKRVGVCAFSHKVVRNLLEAVVRAAEEEKRHVTCLQKVREKSEVANDWIAETGDNAAVLSDIRSRRAQVAGGTAWMWSREEFFEAVDVLFVDEAGQMSLANVLAIASGAKSLVLLGDPQQLDQPIQGSHPEGTEVSALEHVLEGHRVIPEGRGLFLAESWRLPPEICSFTSELFYEGRLQARSDAGLQRLVGAGRFDGAGLWYVPIEHDANRSSSPEEIEAVAGLMDTLLAGGVAWRDRDSQTHQLTRDDILVIAPYNAQVADLRSRLGREARVGTVDKFQGQEAPVVIYSLTSSTPQDAPRGMDFLFNGNRFNVATSRAICACIVVGSPRLFEPDCSSPAQMKLANAFCRFHEVARVVLSGPKAELTGTR